MSILYYNYFSPLEQFIVFNIFNCFSIKGIKLTNLAICFFFVIFAIFCLFCNHKYKVYANNNKNIILVKIYHFLKEIYKENVTISKPYFFAYIFFVFMILICSNVLGLVP